MTKGSDLFRTPLVLALNSPYTGTSFIVRRTRTAGHPVRTMTSLRLFFYVNQTCTYIHIIFMFNWLFIFCPYFLNTILELYENTDLYLLHYPFFFKPGRDILWLLLNKLLLGTFHMSILGVVPELLQELACYLGFFLTSRWILNHPTLD